MAVKLLAVSTLMARSGLTACEIDKVQTAAMQVADEILPDLIAANDGTAIFRDALMECVVDAGRLVDRLRDRGGYRSKPDLAMEELASRLAKLPYETKMQLIRPAFMATLWSN